MGNMAGVLLEAGTAYPLQAPDFSLVLVGSGLLNLVHERIISCVKVFPR